MPWLIAVRHTSAGDDLVALNAPGGELVLVTASAVDIIVPRNEAPGADRVAAHAAAEALLVPLVALVLHLLRASAEDLAAAIAAGGEGGVVAGSAVDLLSLGAERLVHQRHAALAAQEAGLVPVLLLVRQVLGVDADGLGALLARVSEHLLVAAHAVRVLVAQHVSLAGQRVVALPAAEVARVPVLVHGLRVLPGEDQLIVRLLVVVLALVRVYVHMNPGLLLGLLDGGGPLDGVHFFRHGDLVHAAAAVRAQGYNKRGRQRLHRERRGGSFETGTARRCAGEVGTAGRLVSAQSRGAQPGIFRVLHTDPRRAAGQVQERMWRGKKEGGRQKSHLRCRQDGRGPGFGLR